MALRFALLLLALFAVILSLWFYPHQLTGHGGFPVPGEIMIPVPQFFQDDPGWKEDPLGATAGTLGGQGCAVTSAAMVLKFYGMDIDPRKLNHFLSDHGGYEGEGWIRWESAAEYSPGLVEKAYEGMPSYGLIDWNLLRGNPVIVRVRLPNGITHFVVIVGKRGLDYLILNPAGWGEQEGGLVTPLSGLGVPVEALRFYRRL
jgi:hypothetical protein